ncbi:helix-turn-helix domain-containing protein [Mesorhizobium sp.]|uniref:helix-turn-helix domain-containing protein n=1 Tax=Mesorhizobium sp. TaxID=1871066 RepID=UPI000FE3BD29|nr:helix-turn-helix domain-containing protein [Mesorhizobium sp.]RWQ21573.1 MAG: DNA-binding protein [Mesorhizobium sp.]
MTISMTIPAAVASSGLGRTTIYELIRDGKLDARKQGTRTLVLADSLRRHIESLPKVEG